MLWEFLRRVSSGSCKGLIATLLLVYQHPSRAEDSNPRPAVGNEIVTVAGPAGTFLSVRVLTPPGHAPFPLAIVNHGSPPSASQRPSMAVPTFRSVSDWLLDQGYLVVLPLRRGYGETGGDWAENYGACRDPDYYRAGMASAADIIAVLAHFQPMANVRADRILVVGWSAGGWASLALASQNPAGVFAIINFAGGRGGGQPVVGNCAPERLVEASTRFGTTARVPTMWLYSENDRLFGPPLSQRMYTAFMQAGGYAKFVQVPAFKADGHQLFVDPDGRLIWEPLVLNFLAGF